MYFEVYSKKKPFKRRQYYWRLKSANHEIIASGEGYFNKEDCYRAVALVQDVNIDTPIRKLV